MEENYAFIKQIRDITDIFDVSESYVFQIYRRRYGTTPKQYINGLRIRHACHRLKHTEHTVRSIALGSGFDSYEYFAAVFKGLVGCTPMEYRRRQKADGIIP
ncbi:MAG: AraC family transcriptional regulator [Roseburia sp.]|nr:AraC family transcriptional regulator [Roseburia sp.]